MRRGREEGERYKRGGSCHSSRKGDVSDKAKRSKCQARQEGAGVRAELPDLFWARQAPLRRVAEDGMGRAGGERGGG